MKLLRLIRSSLALWLAAVAAPAADTPRIFLAGDSTMANKPLDLPERGWGMALGQFFQDPAMVQNHAMNGRSTKSFIDEGRWQKIVDDLHAGDFVIIQFGHNDEKVEDPKRGTDPKTTFPENLRRFIREVRAKNASPILATPAARRKFDKAGQLQPTHGAYPDAIRAVAASEKVPLLELEKATMAWLQTAGDEPSKKFFMWIEPGKFAKIPDGRKDDTHFVEAGATKVAELAVTQLREQKLPLAPWLK
ncbi:MAG: rhamnogalacturonan acetylesterase [Verrucomicrobia bacterium]|nr:rhamnogalacturonan acetylesterase [Verrucomicrobiota bacterium]